MLDETVVGSMMVKVGRRTRDFLAGFAIPYGQIPYGPSVEVLLALDPNVKLISGTYVGGGKRDADSSLETALVNIDPTAEDLAQIAINTAHRRPNLRL